MGRVTKRVRVFIVFDLHLQTWLFTSDKSTKKNDCCGVVCTLVVNIVVRYFRNVSRGARGVVPVAVVHV